MIKKLAVVLPTFNEKENLQNTITEILAQAKNLADWDIHIIVSDSHSTDKTGEVAKKLAEENPKIHFIEVERGLGVGLIKGHQYALKKIHPDVMAQLDADGQVEADVLVRLVQGIEQGYDFVMGSRLIKGGSNQLSFSRRIFTLGSSLMCRFLMGPMDVKEFTNSARAFTPEIFKKIDLNSLPWREKTFIVQPAFVNEMVKAGAKYKEVPLVFKNRLEGYSKNKVFNYTYDVITYVLDARFKKWGLSFPLFYVARRAKTVVKFGMVGFVGTVVDFIFYKFFINLGGFPPATSKGISTEVAILNNFLLNNYWTFKYRKTKTSFAHKLGLFNLVSLGGLAISVMIVKFFDLVYGEGSVNILGLNVAYNNFYFFATIPPVMVWNFVVNHLVTWRNQNG
ncbi:glycosyltransferase [Candidatus Daviesbacteria bacterium]|nr:glycosyltransferase [Candidatus Daviesbacteria bacterium]